MCVCVCVCVRACVYVYLRGCRVWWLGRRRERGRGKGVGRKGEIEMCAGVRVLTCSLAHPPATATAIISNLGTTDVVGLNPLLHPPSKQ